MHALIVVSHPEPGSLTHSVARRIAAGFESGADRNTTEIADLAAEGFDPRFSAADLSVHRQQARPPLDVAREQARIERADVVVLVFPVYWWSMPALLKGWIDRVFSNGWAFDFRPDTPLVKKLGRLRMQVVGIAGADAGTYARHGYAAAMRTQIDHGMFDYCGVGEVRSELLFDSESADAAMPLEAAFRLGAQLGADRAAASARVTLGDLVEVGSDHLA